MPNGANSVHKQLRTELENYIKSQYFGKTPILLSALNNHIDDEGLLYQNLLLNPLRHMLQYKTVLKQHPLRIG